MRRTFLERTKERFGIVLVAMGMLCGIAHAEPTLPPGFSTQLIAKGLANPTGIDFATGGRMFVAIKDGRVRVILNGKLLYRPFVDYRTYVNNVRDRGLLGIAVHPDFPVSPYIYLLFTYDPIELQGREGLAAPDGKGSRVGRLIRLEADPDHNYLIAKGADPYNGSILVDDSHVKVLLGKNSTFENIGNPAYGPWTTTPSCDVDGKPVQDCMSADEDTHTIGSVRFALDGSLLVSNGDGSMAYAISDLALRSQDLDSMSGKLMRIHPVTGEGYADNPYFDGDFDTNRSKVWNSGLRNPFRITVHPEHGEVYIGDVGWGKWEEINIAGMLNGGGRNFGWPCYEGNDQGNLQQASYISTDGCQAILADSAATPITAPAHSYSHLSTSGSIQLGDFYMGETWPQKYRGALFYSDINNKLIRYMDVNANGNLGAMHSFASNAGGIAEIRSAPDTNLYYVDVYGGEIRRIVYTAGGNTPPTPIISLSSSSGVAPLPVTFDGSQSFDPDGDDITYLWSFGDGEEAIGQTVQYTYQGTGNYTVSLTVTDEAGLSHFVNETIEVGNMPPVAVIDAITNQNGKTKFSIGDSVLFSGRGEDLEDGAIDPENLSWNAKVHHREHQHLDYYAQTGSTGQFEYIDHDDDSHIELCLTVTDQGELSHTVCENIYPQQSVVTIESVPSGVSMTFSDVTSVTPFTVTSPSGSTRTISAPAFANGVEFSGWSHGAGALTHNITVPHQNSTIVANYGTTSLPEVRVTDATAQENAGSMVFNLSLTRAPAQTATVYYQLVNGSAQAGNDYQMRSGSVSFAPGVSTASLSVVLINDAVTESLETFQLVLTGGQNLVLSNDKVAVGSIQDDDQNNGQVSVYPKLITTFDRIGSGDYGWVLFQDNTKHWVDGVCRSQLEADGLVISAKSWNYIAQFADRASMPCSQIIDRNNPPIDPPVDPPSDPDPVEGFPRIITTPDKLAAGNYGWVLFANGRKQWVSGSCRADLESAGLTMVSQPWSTISTYPDGTVIACDQIAGGDGSDQSDQSDSGFKASKLLVTSDRVAAGNYGWVLFNDGTKHWVDGVCRDDLQSQGLIVEASTWTDISAFPDTTARDCGDISF